MKQFILIISLLTLTACSTVEKDPTEGWSDQKLYEHAKQALHAGEFKSATNYFEILEARYPFGKYAIQTQLEIAYAYYKNNEPVSAIAALDRFIRFNPKNKHLPYVYYLKGLTLYSKGRSFFDSYMPTDFSDIDQKHLAEAFLAFKTLVNLYPKSQYSNDARLRMVYLRNKMAESELKIARYYTLRGAHISSINRIKYLLNQYPSSPFIKDALVLLKENYQNIKHAKQAKMTETLIKQYEANLIYWRKS
jgi:outer membrane protein assembly factor BamD